MQNAQNPHLDQVFAALAHPVRRAILEQCGDEPQSILDVARPHEMSLNAVSKHIKSLEAANLISREKDGNYHRIKTRPESLQIAIDWLKYHTDLWEQSLLALKTNLEPGR